jgi:hypothetical protein
MWSWLWLAVASAWAGVPFELPPQEPPEHWIAPMALAGFEPGEADGGAGVTVSVRGAEWELVVRDASGNVEVVRVASPRTRADREAVVWLADSLIRPVGDPGLGEPRPIAPPPVVVPEPAPEPVAEPEPAPEPLVEPLPEPPPPDPIEPAALPPEMAVEAPAPMAPPEPAPAPEPVAVPTPAPVIAPPPSRASVRALVAGGGALRAGLGPTSTLRIAAERGGQGPVWAIASLGRAQPRAPEIADGPRAVDRWEFDAGVAWALPAPASPRLEATVGLARVGFYEDGAPVGSRLTPRLSVAGAADVPLASVVFLRPRVGAARDLRGVRVLVGDEVAGRMAATAVSAELALGIALR